MKILVLTITLLFGFITSVHADQVRCETTENDTFFKIVDNELEEVRWSDIELGSTTYELHGEKGVKFIAADHFPEDEEKWIDQIEWVYKNNQYYGAEVTEDGDEIFSTSVILSEQKMVFSSTILELGLASAFVFGEINCTLVN